MSDPIERVLTALNELQTVMDGDPKSFGEGRDPALVIEVVEAWETVISVSEVFLAVVRQARNLPTE